MAKPYALAISVKTPVAKNGFQTQESMDKARGEWAGKKAVSRATLPPEGVSALQAAAYKLRDDLKSCGGDEEIDYLIQCLGNFFDLWQAYGSDFLDYAGKEEADEGEPMDGHAQSEQGPTGY